MELGFDHQDLVGRFVRPDADSAPSNLLVWADLKARFIAAHALRAELARAESEEPAGGSFILAGEQVLARKCPTSRLVNPSALGKGKDLTANNGSIPGIASPAIEE